MRDLAVLLLHLLTTIARLAGPGGARSVVSESVLLKQQLLILNRSRKRAPNLRLTDRIVAGVCALLVRPSRLVRSAIILKPATLFQIHRALTNREIGFRKISARAKERHIGESRRRVRQAITEVEPGLVAASTEPRMRIDGGFPVVLAKGHDAYIPVGQKALKKHSRFHRQARSQDERRFDKGGGSDRQRVRLIELRKEIETTGFFRGNRDDGRRIQDHTPSGP